MIRVIDNFFSKEECIYYRNMINNSINTEKLVCFSNSAKSINHKYENLDLVNIFYDRAVEKIKENDFIKPNNLIMWAKYEPGAEFGLHTDTGLYYDTINKLKSRYTLLVYLNDNFEGGNTVFYDNSFVVNLTVVPKEGSCIIFDIDLWHKGDIITYGEKYWIGCEIISNF